MHFVLCRIACFFLLFFLTLLVLLYTSHHDHHGNFLVEATGIHQQNVHILCSGSIDCILPRNTVFVLVVDLLQLIEYLILVLGCPDLMTAELH